MLVLKDITKEYRAGDLGVMALKGVSLSFRQSEFVSVLGPSGCGKTTLLNIIGGLDQYTEGDLSINGKSTKDFKDSDWDLYRNHSIGFVFQSYNLISHQSVLSNVELALTLSGVSKAERRRRARQVLEQVGLGDQIHKKPGQMSGGQMQRVAIARALINDPDILLADEPTGALDTETSVQVMDILKEVARNRLVVMVTHNPDLANRYSTRIIRLLDGKITDDSDPYDGASEVRQTIAKSKKTAMSFLTATALSLNNLMTKKTRTFLTAFAGSIGIIGIALILSLSNGIQNYIDKVQEDTLSTYPLSIQAETVDMGTMISALADARKEQSEHPLDKVYSSTMMQNLMNAMTSTDKKKNNLSAFQEYIEDESGDISQYISDIQYAYGTDITVYSGDTSKGITRINPTSVFDNFYGSFTTSDQAMSSMTGMMSSAYTDTMQVWQEMLDNQDLLQSQYDVIAGRWPESWDEVVIAVDKNNELYDIYLYSLGLKDQNELKDMMLNAMEGKAVGTEAASYTYDQILSQSFKLVLPTELYRYDEGSKTWQDMSDNEDYMSVIIKNAPDIKVVGIIRPSQSAVAASLTGAVGYTSALTEHVIDTINDSDIVKQQKAEPGADVLTGLPFDDGTASEPAEAEKAAEFSEYCKGLSSVEKAALYEKIASAPDTDQIAAMADEQMASMTREDIENMITGTMAAQAGLDADKIKGYMAAMTDEELFAQIRQVLIEKLTQEYAETGAEALGSMSADEIAALFDRQIAYSTQEQLAKLYDQYMPPKYSESTYEDNMKLLGSSERTSPTAINIYTDSFESKDKIVALIDQYNQKMSDEGKEEYVINYTDYVGLIMSSVSTIINVISYVLIAFVSISLVVSSIMIGIITYISVLERTKEIGILRAVGASKRDISRVFNAETLIVGFVAGAIGILITVLMCIPINAVIYHLTSVVVRAELPWLGGVLLVVISMVLTLIAGLIPSRIAAKKDPVEALRTE